MDVGFLTAFIGGMLALLSPCAALLLPAFFASMFGSGPRLLLHGGVFYVGLLLVLVPVGVGAGAIGAAFVSHRELIVIIASLVLVVFGVAQLFGFGFDPAKLLPGSQSLQTRAAEASGTLKTLLLGAASGVAGFCAGPVLGAVLTLAATSGNLFTAGSLLAVYGAGMVVPLLVIAALWQKLGNRGRKALRGRTFKIGKREFHTTSVITGLVLIVVGVIFWTTNGLVSAPSLVPTDIQAWLQTQSALLANPLFDIIAVSVIAVVILAIWWFRGSRQKVSEKETVER